MWGADFPHFDGAWPDSAAILERQFDGVPLDDQIAIGRNNVIKLVQPAARAGLRRDGRADSLKTEDVGQFCSAAACRAGRRCTMRALDPDATA